MSEKRISGNEFVKDIRAGMSNSSLMMKYQISSEEKLQNFLKKLVAAGHLQLSEIDERSHIFKCPACGKFHYEEFSECPSCGIIVSKFVAKKAEENKKVGNDQNINDNGKGSDENEIDDKKRVITIGFIFGWIFGILLLLSGVTSIFTNPLIGLMMLVMAAALLPPIVTKFENKFNIKITRKIKTFVLVACFFVIAVIGSIEGEIRRTKQEKITKESIVPKPALKNSHKKGTSSNIERKKTPKPVAKQKMSMEHTLAFLDVDGYIPEDHISVARFRSLLHQLSSTYNADKDRIGNATVAIQNELKKKGIRVTLLNILEGMNRIYTTGKANSTYEECGAAYMILRDKGQSHRETIIALKAFLDK